MEFKDKGKKKAEEKKVFLELVINGDSTYAKSRKNFEIKAFDETGGEQIILSVDEDGTVRFPPFSLSGWDVEQLKWD